MEARLSQLTEAWSAYKLNPSPEGAKVLADSTGYLLSLMTRLSLNEYQLLAKDTAIYPEAFALEYLGMKLASEAGEVAGDLAKRLRDDEGVITPQRHNDLVEELGDVLWYVSELASRLGVSLEEVATRNVRKLSDRKKKGTLKGKGKR